MAAYEDFEFFRTSRRRASAPPRDPAPTPRDALTAELARLHDEVRRLRAHQRARRRGARLGRSLRRLVARLLPRAEEREELAESA